MSIYKKTKDGIRIQRRSVQTEFVGESLTEQHHKDACNINNIVKKLMRGEVAGNVNSKPPVFGDFSSGQDYLDYCNIIVDAKESFDSLPAHVRKRFQNDPSNLLDFISHEENRDEAIKLGLISKPAEQAPQAQSERSEGPDKGPDKAQGDSPKK